MLEDALTLGVQRMAAEAREQNQEHPSPELLVAYDAGELAEDEAAGVRRHLAVCPECARTVLDLASFPHLEPAPGVVPLSDQEEEAQWQAIRERLAAEAPRTLRRSSSPSWTFQLLAAGLALACLGLGGWVWRLQGRLAEEPAAGSAASGINVFPLDLAPLDASGKRGPAATSVPAGMRSLLLRLNLADARPFDDYRVTVRKDGVAGEVVWSRDGLVRQPEGNFSVVLPCETLPGGSYRIEVEGLRAQGPERLAEYTLVLRYEVKGEAEGENEGGRPPGG